MTSSRPQSMFFEIDISNNHHEHAVDIAAIRAAIKHALSVEQVASAVLSVTIVDNDEIHAINRQHLQHDYPTDVISFQLDWSSAAGDEPPMSASGRSAGASIEGEIIVSSEYADESAAAGQWTTESELILYVVHGLLHICGYDDLTPDEKIIMRSREKEILGGLGLSPVYPADEEEASHSGGQL